MNVAISQHTSHRLLRKQTPQAQRIDRNDPLCVCNLVLEFNATPETIYIISEAVFID